MFLRSQSVQLYFSGIRCFPLSTSRQCPRFAVSCVASPPPKLKALGKGVVRGFPAQECSVFHGETGPASTRYAVAHLWRKCGNQRKDVPQLEHVKLVINNIGES